MLHHPDVGGIDEGSFCINARNLYQDPPRYFFGFPAELLHALGNSSGMLLVQRMLLRAGFRYRRRHFVR